MHIKTLIGVEFTKVKRSRLLPIILIPPLLVVISGVANISQYFSPEYTNSWAAMFVQSALLFGYYLLPFSMVIVCVMLTSRETQNNGLLKMLTLPVSRTKMALAKFVVLLSYLALELVVFFLTFAVSGLIATRTMGVGEAMPILYLLKWSLYLFLTAIPSVTFMWMLTVLFEKPLISIGLNMLLIIPGVLMANTPLWVAYPYCYSGYLVSTEMHRVSSAVGETVFQAFPFIPCAVLFFGLALLLTMNRFGKKEIR